MRPKTGDHDIQTKINQAIQFLEHNDKVQVNVLFRGREMQHIEEGKRVMDQLLAALLEHSKVESPARMEGKRMVALLAPKVITKQEKPKEKSSGPPKPKPLHPEAIKAAAAKAAAAAAAAEKPPELASAPAPGA